LQDNPKLPGSRSNDDTPNGVNLEGTLTVSDGTHTANIGLIGQYFASNFKLATDFHGGTLVTDTASAASTSFLALSALSANQD